VLEVWLRFSLSGKRWISDILAALQKKTCPAPL